MGYEDSKKLATSIQNNLNEAMQKENKRVPLKINNIYIIKKSRNSYNYSGMWLFI